MHFSHYINGWAVSAVSNTHTIGRLSFGCNAMDRELTVDTHDKCSSSESRESTGHETQTIE